MQETITECMYLIFVPHVNFNERLLNFPLASECEHMQCIPATNRIFLVEFCTFLVHPIRLHTYLCTAVLYDPLHLLVNIPVYHSAVWSSASPRGPAPHNAGWAPPDAWSVASPAARNWCPAQTTLVADPWIRAWFWHYHSENMNLQCVYIYWSL